MSISWLSDSDVEALLTGHEPEAPELEGLAVWLQALQRTRFGPSDPSRAAEFAVRAAALVSVAGPAHLAATARHRRGPSLTPRLATAAVAAFLVIAMTGLTVAADASVPGEPLYGLDLALESIGIADGQDSERISEANVLAAEGDSAAALALLADTLSARSDAAADALLRASERLNGGKAGGVGARDVQKDLAAMLKWMSSTDPTGSDFGQSVAERARELGKSGDPNSANQGAAGNEGNNVNNGNPEGGPPGGTPPGQSEEPPGQRGK
jgi:hypothetical protein